MNKLEDLGHIQLSKSFLCVISSIAKSLIGTVYQTSPTILTLPFAQAKNSANNCSNHSKKNLDVLPFAPHIAHQASTNLATKKDITARIMKKLCESYLGLSRCKRLWGNGVYCHSIIFSTV